MRTRFRKPLLYPLSYGGRTPTIARSPAARLASRGLRELPAGEMSSDPLGVQRQHGELRRWTADEAVDEHEILCLLRREHFLGALPGGLAVRQAGSDLEARVLSGRQRSNVARSAADEEGLVPAWLDH